MTKESIVEKLKDIICDYVEVERDEISPDMSFSYDIGLDSFGLISLVCSIEDNFCIKIPEYELTSFQTMQDMVSFIEKAV